MTIVGMSLFDRKNKHIQLIPVITDPTERKFGYNRGYY